MQFTVFGEPASKANSRRSFLNKKTGKNFFAKSEKAENFSDAFLAQCPRMWPPLEGDLFAFIKIYYGSRRPDLDESLVLDLMQKAFIYKNDRQVKGRLTLWALDPGRPRVEIALWPVSPKPPARPARPAPR
ncbi:hypothetical protein [Planktothrix phage Pra-JY27]